MSITRKFGGLPAALAPGVLAAGSGAGDATAGVLGGVATVDVAGAPDRAQAAAKTTAVSAEPVIPRAYQSRTDG
jgi:hypothetical protein